MSAGQLWFALVVPLWLALGLVGAAIQRRRCRDEVL